MRIVNDTLAYGGAAILAASVSTLYLIVYSKEDS